MGEYFIISIVTDLMILALIMSKSALVISAFRGTPAVITTISQSFTSAGVLAAVIMVPLEGV